MKMLWTRPRSYEETDLCTKQKNLTNIFVAYLKLFEPDTPTHITKYKTTSCLCNASGKYRYVQHK